MEKKERKKVVITGVTKRFIESVENLIDSELEPSYKVIADKIGWTEASISSVRALRINVPNKYVKTFEEVYKIPIITKIDDNDIQNRLLRIESTLEVFLIAIAGLKAKRKEDFDNKFSELQKLISEAVKRRKDQSDE